MSIKKSNTKIFKPCIAFKLNYCDGGKDSDLERIGFHGICSDKMIKYNVEKPRAWCSNDDCVCKQYYDKKISRAELEENWTENIDGKFPCYESAAIRDYAFGAGSDHYTGGRKIRGAKAGHLCLLTTVAPNMKECDRFIVAMFLISRIVDASDEDATFIYSNEHFDFCVDFNSDEAPKMKFWKVYRNSDSSIKWGSGLFRYFSDDDAVKFLKMAIEVTIDPDDKDSVEEFLDFYCDINNLDS